MSAVNNSSEDQLRAEIQELKRQLEEHKQKPAAAPSSGTFTVVLLVVLALAVAGYFLGYAPRLINVASGQALEVYGGSTSNGAKVDQWPYSSGANQQWSVVQVSAGVYNLKNVNSGEMLDVIGGNTANGTLMDQWPSSGGTNQQWKFQ